MMGPSVYPATSSPSSSGKADAWDMGLKEDKNIAAGDMESSDRGASWVKDDEPNVMNGSGIEADWMWGLIEDRSL